jgi:hypothetical protein
MIIFPSLLHAKHLCEITIRTIQFTKDNNNNKYILNRHNNRVNEYYRYLLYFKLGSTSTVKGISGTVDFLKI